MLFFVGLILTLFKAGAVQAEAPANFSPTGYNAAASAAMVMDAKSGQVLYAKNAKAVLPVASMSKMVSLYLVQKAIKNGQIQWTDTVTPNAAQAALSEDTELSNVPLTAGTAYTVKELYEASWIYSANVAVMLLAQKVAGSQEAFVSKMQEQLHNWGINDATIVNVSGLNNSLLGDLKTANTDANGENKLSAYEVALVAQHVVEEAPSVLQITKVAKQTFHAGQAGSYEMTNWNMMLPGLQMYDAQLAVDGLKTGTSDLAGDCFTATLTQDGRRLIAVVMHADGNSDDKTKRFAVAKDMLTNTLSNWHYAAGTVQKTALPKHQKIKVQDGKRTYVALSFKRNQKLWRLTNQDTLTGTVTLKASAKDGLTAPVKANTTVGTYQLAQSQYVWLGKQPKLAVTTQTAVARLPWYQILYNRVFHRN